MTFKDLQRVIESQPGQELNQNQLQKLRNKEFWYWDKMRHKARDRVTKGECCFNHIIGCPKKNGTEYPMFEYEKLLHRALFEPGFLNNNPKLHSDDKNNVLYPFKEKHIWCKKAAGLGISTFFLRLMAWLCLYNDDYRDSQMVIVTGPNIDLAIKLIRRMKAMFADKLGVTFDSKETVLELNGCSIEAYPSNHIDSFRSLTNPKFILLDESDFHRKNEQDDVRAVSERYIAKSDPFIVMVSTPNAPGGLFERIEKEPVETCLYKKFFLDYLWGVGKIYTQEEIDKAKLSPSFPREYELQYLGLIGNVFSTLSIENATKLEYNPDNINPNAKKSVGVDPAFGGDSKFAIVVTQFVDGKIQVIFAEEYERPNFQAMINRIWEIKQKCGYISNIYVDAANPEIWESLKREFNESFNQQYMSRQIADCKKYNLHLENRMIVVPVPFSVEGAHMLQHAKWLMEETDEDGSSLIAIHKERFDKLITALRTAVANEYKLDKTETSFSEALTDGVFAIIMTILVFNISAPELILFTEGEHTEERLSNKFASLWPDILAYIISFTTLGVYWVTHHRIFRSILYVNRPLIWINILFLMIMGFVPFSTTLLTQYLDQQISILAYSFNAILAGVIVYALYFYAKRHPELVDKTVPPLIGIRAGRRIVVTTLTYSVAILFSFIHLPAIWVLLLLVLIPEFIPDRYFGKLQEPSELGS